MTGGFEGVPKKIVENLAIREEAVFERKMIVCSDVSILVSSLLGFFDGCYPDYTFGQKAVSVWPLHVSTVS